MADVQPLSPDTILKLSAIVEDKSAELEFIEDTDHLSREIFVVDRSFVDVLHLLSKVQVDTESSQDDLNHKAQVLQQVEHLIRRWSECRMNYLRVCWQSRRTSGEARAHIASLCDDIIPDLRIKEGVASLEEKKRDIDDFLQRVAKIEQKAESVSSTFMDLKTAMLALEKDCVNMLSAKHPDEISLKSTQFDKEITRLTAVLSQLQEKITSHASIPDFTAVGDGVSTLFSYICPKFWEGKVAVLLGDAVNSLTAVSPLSPLPDATVIDTSNGKEAAVRNALALTNALQKATTDYVRICSQLSPFKELWSAVRTDLGRIRSYLECETSDPDDLDRRLVAVGSLYNSFSKVLQRHQTTNSYEVLEYYVRTREEEQRALQL